jgi:hypothetical protein
VKRPDFLIAGFSKCGTTGLLHNLARHPSVATNPRRAGTSEIHFFNRDANWQRGLDWYFAQFPDAQVAGEKTPSYVYDPKAMQRIAQSLPGVKLILCLRNPVDRLYSWYHHKVLRDKRASAARWPLGRFREFHELEAYDPALTGCYDVLIEKNVLPLFPRERIRYVIQERLDQRGPEELNGVLDFLGLGPLDGALLRRNESAYGAPLDAKERALLRGYYARHIERTFELLGFRVREWES